MDFVIIFGTYTMIGLSIFIYENRRGELNKKVDDQSKAVTLLILLVFWPMWVLDM